MYVSLKWIKDFVNIDISNPKKLALDFTLRVAEVEEIIYQKDQYKDIVVAKVLNIEKHKDADKLYVCEVYDGKDKFIVITGADNVKKGDIVPYAKPGAVIPENGKRLEVVKFRGIESYGMLCSEAELKLGTDADGIMILTKRFQNPEIFIGKNIAEVFGLDDVILEIDNKSLTHRPDLWGHLGIAREFAAIYGLDLKIPFDVEKIFKLEYNKNDIRIDVKDKKAAIAYAAVLIENIKNSESPDWLKKRLIAIGQRPISLLVDLSNYVMFEIGEPTHAFDYKKIDYTKKIIIRFSEPDEKVITLDGKERILPEKTLLICDSNNKPIAIAGIMGLENSECDLNTTSILLELATFDQAIIRKAAIKLGLRTEASNRFEKSLDPELIKLATARFIQLLKNIQPEVIIKGYGYVDYSDKAKKVINITTEFINKRLGTNLNDNKIIEILKSLEFEVTNNNGNLTIVVPSFRATKDISIKEDIVEEIGRVFGYINIIPFAPEVALNVPHKMEHIEIERKIREFLVINKNLTEILTYPFTEEEIEYDFDGKNDKYEIANPPDRAKPYLKTTLIPDLIIKAKENFRFFEEFKFFEMEHVFISNNGSIKEPVEITGVIALKDKNTAVLEARDVLIDLFKFFNINEIKINPVNDIKFLHPYKSGQILFNNIEIGIFGELHPALVSRYNLKRPVSIFKTFREYIEKYKKDFMQFDKISKYPPILMDLALIIPYNTYVSEVIEIIKKTEPELIKEVIPFDIYTGKNIPDGFKSVAFKIKIESKIKTLTGDEKSELLNNIIKNCEQKGFKLRS